MPHLNPVLFLLCSMALMTNAATIQFWPVSAPAEVHPNTTIFFEMGADSEEGEVAYQMLRAPTSTTFFIGNNRGWPVAVFEWRVPGREAVGSRYTFEVRATVAEASATNAFSMQVVEPPPIASIQLSNGVPVLVCTNLTPRQIYNLEYSPTLPATNWTTLVWRHSSEFTTWVFRDTSASNTMRFYRLSPEPFQCHTVNCP